MTTNGNKYLQTNIPRVGLLAGVTFAPSKLDASKPDLKISGTWEGQGAGAFYIDYRFAEMLCRQGLIRHTGQDANNYPTFAVLYPAQRTCFLKREIGGNKKETVIFPCGQDGNPVALQAQPDPTWTPAAATPAPAAGAPVQAPPVGGAVAPQAPAAAAAAPAAPPQAAGPGMPTQGPSAPPAATAEEIARRERAAKAETLNVFARGSETYLMAMRAAKRALLDAIGVSPDEFLEWPLAQRLAFIDIARPAADTNIIRLEKIGAAGYPGMTHDINALPEKYAAIKEALTGVLQAPPPPPAPKAPAEPAPQPFAAAPALAGKPAPKPAMAGAGSVGRDGFPVPDGEDDDLPF